MDTVQKIEQWSSARAASTIEMAQSRSYTEHPSSNSNSRESLHNDTEALERALEQMSCASSITADSDDEGEQGDVDWLQWERVLDPIQIQRREYGDKTRVAQDWVWELWCR
jgi:hypothetical protein